MEGDKLGGKGELGGGSPRGNGALVNCENDFGEPGSVSGEDRG